METTLYQIDYVSTKTFKDRSIKVRSTSKEQAIKVAKFIRRDIYEPRKVKEIID